MQFDRGANGRNRGGDGGIRLDARVGQPVAAVERRAQRLEIDRAGHGLGPACLPLHQRERPGHAVVRQQRGFDACFRHPALGGAFDHRDRAALQLRQCVLVAAGDRHRVRGDKCVIAAKPRRHGGGRELSIGAVMPAAPPERRLTGEIAEPQLNFVRRDQRRDHVATAAVFALAHRERRRDVTARMRGIAREVIVVAVEIAQQAAVDEGRERR